MAEFSKQWCDMHDPGGLRPDFDIDEVLDSLQPGYYKPYICEGFGFIAIGKDEKGEGILAFTEEIGDVALWENYNTFMQKQSNK